MDYKLNILTAKLTADEDMLPEISGLHFVTLGEDKILFDYDAYFEENQIEPIDYRVFSKNCRYFIESYAKLGEFKTSEIFYKNTDGHILVIMQLVYLFLGFANPELLGYLTSLLNKVVSEGVSYSQGFVFDLAARNLPTEVIEELIKIRKEEANG